MEGRIVSEVVVRRAVERDANVIARFHGESIRDGFLSSLGARFLGLLYETVTTSEGAFCVLAESDGRPVGFVAGCLDTGGLYRDFVRKSFLKALLVLGPKLVRPRTLMRVAETLWYPRTVGTSLPKAELLSIAVAKGYRGKGVSGMLLDGLAREFRARGVCSFRAVVGEGLHGARDFYERHGGVLRSNVEIHKGEKSRTYVWEL